MRWKSVVEWSERTPLADPRSLGGSMLFHALLVLGASAVALSAVSPAAPEGTKALRASLEAVDNRAKPGDEGGGSPGDMGSGALSEALKSLTPATNPEAPARDAPADALLADILPTPPSLTPDRVQQVLPGPSTSVLGLTPSSGSGGGGGSGGGVGGGVGRGVGPGTEFFGAREHATSFAYVIDCSGSMATRGSLDVAKRELVASLNQLPPDAKFGVIFYNLQAIVFSDQVGRQGLMPATARNKARVQAQLREVSPDGGTDHMLALRTALALRPEVIFFLTDADLMNQGDVNVLLNEVGGTRIQAVEFGRGIKMDEDNNPLRRLSTTTGGSYRYIDVIRFPGG